MDASDRIRKVQAKAVFTYYRENVLDPATCNLTNCVTDLSANCLVNYPNFQEKLQVAQGRKACNNCSTSCAGP